jgi:hypothetical protein
MSVESFVNKVLDMTFYGCNFSEYHSQNLVLSACNWVSVQALINLARDPNVGHGKICMPSSLPINTHI